MRSLIIIIFGFVLWWACLGVAKLFGGSTKTATVVFAGLWFAAAVINMWIGVSQAGYSFIEELPVFILIFSLPVAAALLVKWKFL